MKELNYSKRELDHYFKEMKDTVQEINFDVKEIKIQTIKTNGRVSKLEWWRAAVIWSLGVLWTLLLLAGPWLIKRIVDEQIRQTLSTYK